MKLKLSIIRDNASLKEFVQFWAGRYSYFSMPLYNKNIGKKLTSARIFALFKWKNGRELSGLKKAAVSKNYSKPQKKNLPRNNEQLIKELSKSGGVIWRIFWLHCQKPKEFAIYDQHTHRAMAKILGWKEIEIPKNKAARIECYVKDYRPFLKYFGGINLRQLDRALWAYGKFLSQGRS